MSLADPGNDEIVELLISVREDINIMTCEYEQMRRLAREACEVLKFVDWPVTRHFLARPEVQRLMTMEGK
jgi:hypothetical protein